MKPRNKVTVSSTMLATYILSETRFGVYPKSKVQKYFSTLTNHCQIFNFRMIYLTYTYL